MFQFQQMSQIHKSKNIWQNEFMKVLIQLPNTQVKEYLAKLINEGAYTIAKYTSQRISGKIN